MGVLERNNVTVLGNGATTIVFAHGYGCDQTMWNLVTPHFTDRYRVVLFDYVGCGKSDPLAYRPGRYHTLDGYAQDLLEVCAAVDAQDAILVGHSVSSMIGVLAARREPQRFRQVVMLCPSPKYINEPDFAWGFDRAAIDGLLDMIETGQAGWSSFLAGLVVNDANRADLADDLNRSFCAMEPEVARRFAEATFFADNRADLDGFELPCLVVQCSNDVVAAPHVGEYVHSHLVNSTLVVLDADGHCPHLSHPADTVRAIDAFLAAA